MATRENFEKLLGSPNVQKMLDLIANAEGVQHGYNTLFGNERFDDLSRHPNISKEFTQTDGKKNRTNAAGRYQFMKDTWDDVSKQLGLKDFSPRNQDIAAVALLARNGALPSVLKGDLKTAVQKSGGTWASLPSSNYPQKKRTWSDLGIANPARDQYQSQASKIVAAYKQKQKEQEAKAQPIDQAARSQKIVEAYQKAQQNGQIKSTATQPQGLPDFDASGTITHEQPQSTPQQEPTLGQQLLGVGDAALTGLTAATTGTLGYVSGAAHGLLDTIAGGQLGTQEGARNVAEWAQRGAELGTRTPRTQTGQNIVETAGDALGAFPPTLGGGLGMQTAALGRAAIPQAITTAQRTAQAVAPVVERAGQAVQRPIQATANAVRSGVDSVREMVGLRTPEAEGPAPANVGAAQVPIDAQRLAMFDELGVTPTTAQVSRNPSDLAEMYNMARKGGESGRVITEGLEKQQRDLAATIDDMIEKTGAESTNFYATGGKINDALNTQFKVEKARVSKQYNQARESEGAKAKVDLSNEPKWSDAEKTKADDAGYQLDQSNVLNLINDNLDIEGTSVYRNMKNTAVRLGIADEDSNGLLKPKPKGQEPTVNAVEEWRQRINELPSDEKDIRAKTRIKKLIDYALDNSGSNAFKQARKDYGDFKNAWTTRSIVKDLIEMKKGANSGDRKVIDEKIVDRITSTATSQADLDFIKKMITKTEDGQQAWRDLQGTVLNHIRNKAFSGVDDANGSPALLASKLNDTIEKLDGHTRRLDTLLNKQDADKVRLAGDLAKVLKTVPENTGVNWSNTINAGLAGLFDFVFVQGTTGLPLPIATLLRQFVKRVGDKKQVARANTIINSLEKSRRQSRNTF
ncbi:glycoside hydrolase family 24 protein [Acinetobacter baumannii]|uniref:glycoside hydrolase family 24 protein n=1 Tax=Acinetobacter baumannii TaxID=470 RepID=UPI000DE7BA4D|nr:glycoside hydrolase family 104 protein [Acinetobacter baumannii]MCJ9074275.1 glycoside hydrolase family 104 protein [Acinetobacter baumannii]MCJ9563207.1 glycoside hydrolase family 104 protein [Acinetobacter baumannii]SSQ25066.1 Phage lysozyme [Acinetobacter baumannii]